MAEKPPADTDQPNKRSEVRAPTHLRGQVMFKDRSVVLECIVKNVSSRGAKLAIGSVAMIPDHCELHILSRDLVRNVQVAWRKAGQIGVRFVGDPLPNARERNLKRLEKENARLQEEVRAKVLREA